MSMVKLERWSVVGDEDDPATEGHIQYMPLLQDGEYRDTWAFAGTVLPDSDESEGYVMRGEAVNGTPLLEGEQAIVVTCRAEDRATLLAWLCGRLNAWEG
jgi:hypothetical protein